MDCYLKMSKEIWFMVLPHGFSDSKRTERILRQAQLLWDEEKLAVKDEESSSGGSGEE
jgi:hypothetical protein